MSVLDVLSEVVSTAGPRRTKCIVDGCDADYVAGDSSCWVTAVGYFSPPGHNHDDNCRTYAYACAEGHVASISPINRCHKRGCGWVGKDSCFCTNKVPSLPEVDQHLHTFEYAREREDLPLYYARKTKDGGVEAVERERPKRTIITGTVVNKVNGKLGVVDLGLGNVES